MVERYPEVTERWGRGAVNVGREAAGPTTEPRAASLHHPGRPVVEALGMQATNGVIDDGLLGGPVGRQEQGAGRRG